MRVPDEFIISFDHIRACGKFTPDQMTQEPVANSREFMEIR
ncbi:MAG: hypothetical protein O2856_06660 [Planctomycetota bacterium]|nr:hypothetical protein [Planctomycetota bacterium]